MTPPGRHAPGAAPSRRGVFLERRTYRRRRMADAAGLLPLVGAVLLTIPLLWQGGGVVKTSHVMFYVFGIWAMLAVLSALVSGVLDGERHADSDADADRPADEDTPPSPGPME